MWNAFNGLLKNSVVILAQPELILPYYVFRFRAAARFLPDTDWHASAIGIAYGATLTFIYFSSCWTFFYRYQQVRPAHLIYFRKPLVPALGYLVWISTMIALAAITFRDHHVPRSAGVAAMQNLDAPVYELLDSTPLILCLDVD